VLKEVNAKNGEPVAAPPRGRKRGCGGRVFEPAGVPLPGAGAFHPRLPAKPPPERRVQTEAAIVDLSRKRPRYDYRRVHALVLRRGLACAQRTVQRVRRREGLRVFGAARRPRCPARPGAKIKAEGVNDVRCVDLVFDATRHGVTLKFLTIVDEGSHYCIDISVWRRMTARDVVRALDEAVRRHGKPRHLRCDNGGEFIAGVLQRWLKERGIVARFIEPGSPWQNGVNKSFNGRIRDDCLNREPLDSALDGQVIARAFCDEYNYIRPHSSLDYRALSAVLAELLQQAPGSYQAFQAKPSLRPEPSSTYTTKQ
jgi:putative transposase